jgi:predicted Zn finger-like uncharacterized protein
MSLLTRCPACTTLYKVVPDQLRISQGWVKCGQCGEIFDATQHLMEASTEPAVVSPEELSGGSPSQVAERNQDIAQLPHDLSEPESTQKVDLVIDEDVEIDSFDEGPWSLHNDAAPTPSENELLSHSPGMSEAQVSIPVAEPQPESQQAPTQDTVLPLSFMRDASQPSAWHHPWARGVWVGFCVSLVMGLAGQWVYQDHDRLAASQPQWRPALETLCNALHCSVAPLQQIESIAIDAAAFSQGAPGRYRLSFTLKNTTGLMLAMPSIELTLTDVQDRVVMRRVLSVQDLAVAADHLAANAEWPVAVDLHLQTEVSAPTVVGYRLLAFYP